MSTTAFAQQQTAHSWWQHWRPRITALYLLIALVLLLLSLAGHIRLWGEIGKTFGGFTWMVDPDSPDHAIIIITTPPQLPPFVLSADSLTSTTHIATVNSLKGSEGSERVYKHARPGDTITYTTQTEQTSTKINKIKIYTRPAATFTLDMWWQTFGLPFLAGIIWLAVGAILLTTAPEWTSGVEGITLLPPAMLLLLYSHWGNIQTAHTPDLVAQLLWIPSFALLGAAFIHLSLNYRPATMNKVRQPDWRIDGLPYAPLVALLLYEWLSVLFIGHVPLRLNLLLSLGYAVIGGVISLSIGITSLWRIAGLWLPGSQQSSLPIPRRIRHYISDLLTLWIGGVGLGFCFGVLPILLTGQALLPLPIFYVLAAVYPLILLYAIRSLRLIARLHATIDQREEALHEQRKMAQTLQMTNQELQQATDLLLHADAHLRSLLSQRIHDQPKQQALRIRSRLGHWQYKLRQEAERDAEGKVVAQPIIEALGKVRKISDELEDDLQGLQLLVEDAYQRRSLGLRLHLEKFIHEDLPVLHPESPLKIQTDLWALDALSPDLENTVQGERIAEAISYTVTQALLNIYNHSGATFAAVRTQYAHGLLTIHISDNGHGFIPDAIAPNKTSLFKARLKVRAANGQLEITSTPPAETGQPTPSFPGPHGTTVTLQIPIPAAMQADTHIQDLHPNNTV